MASLPLLPFPRGCGGCGGACCKDMPEGMPPLTDLERDRAADFLPADATYRPPTYRLLAHGRQRTILDRAPCVNLDEGGLCRLQADGRDKPLSCVEYPIDGPDCRAARKAVA